MGELLPLTCNNIEDIYPMAYQVNCDASSIGAVEGEREFTILTTSQISQPHSSQQFITPISNAYFKTECSNTYSCSYQTSLPESSLNDACSSVSYLQIIEEPFNRHRFRYESERGSHGGMNGENTTNSKKTYPTVKLLNYNGTASDIYIKASLWTDSEIPERHVHKLQHKKSSNVNSPDSGMCVLRLNDDMTCVFQGVSIMFTAKKNVQDILYQREIDRRGPLHGMVTEDVERECKLNAETDAKKLNMNVVRILFEATCNIDDRLICSVLSKPIHNQRELKITRFSRCSGSCSGGEEVYLFCEKVNKKEIKIRFFENDESGQIKWQSYGSFSESDVHHQVAIVFKTPKYLFENITEAVRVFFQLYREKDDECSEPKVFTYIPLNRDPEAISRKRARIDNFDDEDNDKNRHFQYPNHFSLVNRNVDNQHTNFDGFQSTGQSFGGGMQYSSPSSNNTTSDESSSLDAILNPAISPNLSLSDELSFDLQNMLDDKFINSLLKGDGARRRRSPTNSLAQSECVDQTTDSISGKIPLKMTLPEKKMTTANVKPMDSDVIDGMSRLSLTVEPSTSSATCRRRSASLIEGQDTKTLARSDAVNLLLNQFSEALRMYATTADPRALIYPLRNLMARPNGNGDNSLHLAIIHHSSKEDFIQHLLSGVPANFLNVTNNLYQTPLHLAVILDKPAIVQLLLMQGANPAIQDQKGNTAVHLAVLKKHISCLEVILNKQSYRNQIVISKFADTLNYEGFAPIHLAVQEEDESSITKLADFEADINIGDGTSGRTALHLAVEEHPSMLDCLFKQINIDVDCQDFSGETPLHLACHQEDEDVVLKLMQHEANPLVERFLMPDITDTSHSGLTPLDIAEENEHTVIKSILAGEVPEEEKRRIISNRKPSLNESSNSIDYLNTPKSFDSDISGKYIEPGKEQTLQQTHMDSGYASAPQIEEITEDVIEKLCQLLDPPSMEWKKLVEVVFGEDHVQGIEKLCKESPTRAAIDLLSRQDNYNLDMLRNILEASDLWEARSLLN